MSLVAILALGLIALAVLTSGPPWLCYGDDVVCAAEAGPFPRRGFT